MISSDRISSAMIMSAGLGTRLRPFTDLRSKILLPVLGVPVVQFSIDALIQAGVSQLVANVHHRAEETTQVLKTLDYLPGKMMISDETELLLGSGGGIKHAQKYFGGAEVIFLSNADVLCEINWQALASFHCWLRRKSGVRLTLAISPCSPKGGAYREILFNPKDHLIQGLGEKVSERPFFIGAAVIEMDALVGLPEGRPSEFVPSLLEPAIRDKKAGVFMNPGLWFDIGSPSLWLDTHLSLIQLIQKGQLASEESLLWKRRIDSLNTQMRGDVWVSNRLTYDSDLRSWQGPSYWGNETFQGIRRPEPLGAERVLYGDLPLGLSTPERGIGYGGLWVNVPR